MSNLISPLEGILLEALLILTLAFFSAAEAAILAVNRLRAKHQADLGNKGADAVVRLHAKKEDFLPAILALETLLTVLITTLGTTLAAKFYPKTGSLFIAALIITILILSFGEIVPKILATHRADRFAYFCGPFIVSLTRILSILLHPLTWTLGKMIGFLEHDSTSPAPSEMELKYLISLSREHGVLQKEEEELLQNIFDFTDAKVGEVMVPRTQVESLEADASVQDALAKFAETQLSRFPVQEKTLDHVVGVVDIRDILIPLAKGECSIDLKPFIKPAFFVPESKRVGQLLQEMRHDNYQFAIVIDEYGGTAGLVSLTDLIEEIVGKLETQPSRHSIRPIDEKTLVVPASTKVEEIEEALGIKLNAGDIQTIGGLVFHLFGRVPLQGEQISYQNVRFTVSEKDGYRIQQVMIAKEEH